MTRLPYYILKQLIAPVLLFAFLMTCVIWLTQSLQLLDLVINRGQSIRTFVYLTILILPNLLVIILPIAFFFGALYALHRLSNESELVVMASAGMSHSQIAAPVMAAAAIIMAAGYLFGLYLMPLGQRALRETKVDIRADIGSALLNEGAFNTPAKGLTVFIRRIGANGHLEGILVHDNRNQKNPTTYFAENGLMVQTPRGPRLIMQSGTVEQTAAGGARLSMLKFARYVFDLDQFSSATKVGERASNEQFLNELFHPSPQLRSKTRRAYIAEGHNRISQPLYCIAFALIALTAVMRGKRARGAYALRLTVASAAAAGLRIAGYGVQGLAAGNNIYCILFYVIPLVGSLIAIAVFVHNQPQRQCRKA